jgi:SH3 domain
LQRVITEREEKERLERGEKERQERGEKERRLREEREERERRAREEQAKEELREQERQEEIARLEKELADNDPAAEEVEEETATATALYDYQAAAEDEISFDPDDLITHIEMVSVPRPFSESSY